MLDTTYENALIDTIVYAHQSPLCNDDYNKYNDFYKVKLLEGYHVIIAYKFHDNNFHLVLEDHFSKTVEERLLPTFGPEDVRDIIRLGIKKGLEVRADEQ